jgi:hypothetical protein
VIYKTVSDLRDDINKTLVEKNAAIKLQKQSKGILVWIEYKGKRSLGFYADVSRYKNRLTKEGMNSWVQDSLAQLSLVEQIESIFLNKGVSSSFESSISLKIEKMYS